MNHDWVYARPGADGSKIYRCQNAGCTIEWRIDGNEPLPLLRCASAPSDEAMEQAHVLLGELDALARQEGGSHYKDMAIQPVEYIHANNIPFIEGCVIKYVTRWRAKNGVEDLKKAKHFLDLLIDLEARAKK